MTEKGTNPFDECPIYQTQHFTFRMVEEEDVDDLLKCYSDPKSAEVFNSDNCNSNFVYESHEELKNLIKFWIMEYNNKGYVRFSIVDKLKDRAIGTIEIFAKSEEFNDVGKVGVLRLDLTSEYETQSIINEILDMVDNNFPIAFEINSIITKAIPLAENRIKALEEKEYKKLIDKTITAYDDYYIKTW